MSSEEIGLVPSQRLENGLNSHIVFSDDPVRFSHGAPAQRRAGAGGSEVPKTRDLSGFIDERFFAPQSTTDFRRNVYAGERKNPPEPRNWSGDGSDDGEDDEDEDDMDDDEDEVVVVNDSGKGNGGNIGEGKVENGKLKHHDQSQSQGQSQSQSQSQHDHRRHQFGASMIGGSSRDGVAKESGVAQKASPHSHGHDQRLSVFEQNSVTVAENDGYYSQYFQGNEDVTNTLVHKDLGPENGCGFSGRKDGSYVIESGDSLRSILSDPVNGALMDDAMILPCGHSFGGGGIQHVIRTKSCYTCSQSTSEESIAPNLSLRTAVQAFRREDELQFQRSSKRKKERLDQEKSLYGDSALMDLPRGRGVQFPFSVMDRVIIKGNKRTPQRFVGREAVVTTQCLNGWYVVKTLDNAESVKLQYRSLAKVPHDAVPKLISSKAPTWL